MSRIYEFAFQRRDLIKIATGVSALGILLFAAGLLSGLGWQGAEQPAPVIIANLSLPENIKQQIELCVVPQQPVAIAWEDIPAVDPADENAAAASEAEVAAAVEAVEAVAIAPRPAVLKQAQAAPRGRSRSEFSVQLGAFLQSENALALSRRLDQRGYNADVVPMEGARGRTWYLVRFGVFETRTEALMAAAEFKNLEGIDALVRQSDSM